VKPDERLLIATDVASDARLIVKLLTGEFDGSIASTDPDQAAHDFDALRPQVLILAFNSLAKAERFSLGLYRHSKLIHLHPHRTVVLCNKDELQRAYELCRQDYFDDYVLFWPLTFDAPRLPMAVHLALRDVRSAAENRPSGAEFAAQARRVAELEPQLDRLADEGRQHASAAAASLQQVRRDIDCALDGLARRVEVGEASGAAGAAGRAALDREIRRLKEEEVERGFRAASAAAEPVQRWIGSMKSVIAPQLESVRTLKALADRLAPRVLVVDDDPMQQRLLSGVLAAEGLDLVFAASGPEALALLRRRRADLVLMDIQMPEMDGIEVTRRMKAIEEFAAIPVIMITGHSERSVVVDALGAGAADFVVKPFDRSIVLSKVRSYLRSCPAGPAG
jgi:CheY-like chemotaxis protein